jgi:AraC-like DNA-binding protein
MAENTGATRGSGGEQKDVSLGPACLIVVIFIAIGLSLTVIAMAAMMSGSQGRRAAYSVREQIVPWVEQSSLSKSDRQNIVERLSSLAETMDREELTSRQLSRLVLRLTDSTVLQWGVIEELNRAAQKSEMTDAEKLEFSAACDRGLRTASEGRLALQKMEFAVQNVATKDLKSGRLTIRDDVNEERLREFLRRLEAISDQQEMTREPFDKSVSQVMNAVVDDALAEK